MDDIGKEKSELSAPDSSSGVFGPWGHKPIRLMVYWTNSYVVYLDKNLDVDFELTIDIKLRNGEKFNRVLNEATILEGECNKRKIREPQIIQFKRLIGEAIACAIEEDYVNAQQVMDVASSYIQARSKETSREWIVFASLVSTLIIITLGIL